MDNNTIRFEYQDMVGTFLVKYFDKDTEKILVKYNNREIWCHRSTFRRNNICRIIGIIDNDFRYEIGHRYITDNFDFTITDKKVINNKKCTNTSVINVVLIQTKPHIIKEIPLIIGCQKQI